jgi:hypothetical protein
MIGFVLGAATGYVLGARAGRERYEQLARAYRRISDHPAVQSAAGVVRERATGVVSGRLRSHHDGQRNGQPAEVTSIPRA